MNLRKLKNQAGFTLVELIVVIAIMAILAGVAVPVYSGYIEKAEKAGDLQLLGAVNSAFGAAVIENGAVPQELSSASAPISGGKVTSVSASDVDSAALNASFNKYFAGNQDATFKVIKQLIYVQKDGVFKDPATVANTPGSGITAVNYGGTTIYMSEQDIQNLKDSTFLNASTLKGSSGLLDQVNMVTGIAAGMADGALSAVYNDPEFVKTAMSVLGVTTKEEYEAKVIEMATNMYNNGNGGYASYNDALAQVQANAAVLYAAESATKFTTDDINKLFSDTGIDEIKNNLKTQGQTTTGMAQSALVYGMYTAYAHSEEYGNATLQANTGNASEVLKALQEDANFKKYVASEAGQKDIDAYMGALGVITDSAKSDPAAVEHLITNGFANSELKEVVAGLTGK